MSEQATWRYAMTREQWDTAAGPEDFFTIREVYEGPDGALSWTKDAIAARGDSWMECADDLAKMTRAMNGPILDLTLDPPRFVRPRDLVLAADPASATGEGGGDRG